MSKTYVSLERCEKDLRAYADRKCADSVEYANGVLSALARLYNYGEQYYITPQKNTVLTFKAALEAAKGKLCIIFLDDSGDDYQDFFREEPRDDTPIRSVRLYQTPGMFIDGWKRMADHPDGMWYWCFDCRGDDNCCFCSGACDPDDINGFREYFRRTDNERS